MNKAIHATGLQASDKEFLARIERNLGIIADLSRADILMYVASGRDFAIISQARPHSMAPIHRQNLAGSSVQLAEAGLIGRVFSSGRQATEEVERWGDTAPMVRQLHPVRGPGGNVVAVVTVETNLIEHERHRRRHVHFRRALTALQRAGLRAEIPGVDQLIPFGEQDGIVFVDEQRRIRYLSGIATNFYRRLGYMEPLVGQHLDFLETGDDELVGRTLAQGRCFRGEAAAQEREWVRQAIPVYAPPRPLDRVVRGMGRGAEADRVIGAFLLVHDETEKRRRQRELQVKSAIIQETHHRVKNNLQTIAALLRMEARRSTSAEAQRVLEESMNRILSISVVHEFMANQGDSPINLREVGQRLVAHLRQMLAYPDRHIAVSMSGPDIYLPAQQATVCSLVINELLQNAAEHGFAGQARGSVHLRLAETADRVLIEVEDDGVGLLPDFDLNRNGSVGLNIVQVLVRDDLKGDVRLTSNGGVTATVTFPKTTQEVKPIGAYESYHS
ncbi:MAG: hypothetical protein HPY83_14045 [Anaerolineae bacterium]|nr:hypothetical protein [Anaerolineae bacterium]